MGLARRIALAVDAVDFREPRDEGGACPEIIIEHGFIGVRGSGDIIRTGAGKASLGEMIFGSGENALGSFGVLGSVLPRGI